MNEQDSGTAARILTAARELVLKRGVKGLTVAEIAERAHVGKGTTYLYWGTKEDLVFGLIARDFLSVVDEELDALAADPDICRPHRLCPRLVRGALGNPFVRALVTGDADLLGVLAQHQRSVELLDMVGPAGLIYSVLPVWRDYGLVRTDWPLDEQAFALQALIAGFFATADQVLHGVTVDAPDRVMAAAATALLGVDHAGPAEVRATAEEGMRLLRERRAAVLALITTKQETN
jgi:AcrR family transcriptional regulator